MDKNGTDGRADGRSLDFMLSRKASGRKYRKNAKLCMYICYSCMLRQNDMEQF